MAGRLPEGAWVNAMLAITTIERIAMPMHQPADHFAWIDALQLLVNKFSHLCVGLDLPSMTFAEAWGLYRHLLQLEAANHHAG